jgi:hypothetical protein
MSHTPSQPSKTRLSPATQAPGEPATQTSSAAAPSGNSLPGTAFRPAAGATPVACPGRHVARRITDSPARGNKPARLRKSVFPTSPIPTKSMAPAPPTKPRTSPPANQSAPVVWRAWSQSHSHSSDDRLSFTQSTALNPQHSIHSTQSTALSQPVSPQSGEPRHPRNDFSGQFEPRDAIANEQISRHQSARQPTVTAQHICRQGLRPSLPSQPPHLPRTPPKTGFAAVRPTQRPETEPGLDRQWKPLSVATARRPNPPLPRPRDTLESYRAKHPERCQRPAATPSTERSTGPRSTRVTIWPHDGCGRRQMAPCQPPGF